MSESGIFKAAVKLPPDRRAAYLDQACGSDAQLRAEIESLLHAHDATCTFLEDVPAGEMTLLVGQDGPAYFLVPVFGDVIQEDRELRLAMAKASLRQGWKIAREIGEMSDEEIEAEIQESRSSSALSLAR